jgi:hypothetical protein
MMEATGMEATQKRNLSRKSRGTLTVKWAGSRDKIFSPSGRGRSFFLTSLFIELIEGRPALSVVNEPVRFTTTDFTGAVLPLQGTPVVGLGCG